MSRLWTGPSPFASAMGSMASQGFAGGGPRPTATAGMRTAPPVPGGGDCCGKDSSWGGTRGLCFRPEHAEPSWVHVGAGRGGYEKVETYNYVGEGAGSYDRDHFTRNVIYGWQLRSCCLCLLCSSLLLWLMWALSSALPDDKYCLPWWCSVLPFLRSCQVTCYDLLSDRCIPESNTIANFTESTTGKGQVTVSQCQSLCDASPFCAAFQFNTERRSQRFCIWNCFNNLCSLKNATLSSATCSSEFDTSDVFLRANFTPPKLNATLGASSTMSTQRRKKTSAAGSGSLDLTNCTKSGKDCSDTRCCKDSLMRCFKKNDHWSGCRTSCTPGIFDKDPPQHRTKWSCLLNDKNGLMGLLSNMPTTSPGFNVPTPDPNDYVEVKDVGESCDMDSDVIQCAASLVCLPSEVEGGPGSCVRQVPGATEKGVGQATTKLTEPVERGSTILVVEDQSAMKIGGKFTITDGKNEETGVIAGFGSIILVKPLQNSYDAGATITVEVTAASANSKQNIMANMLKTNHFTFTRGEVPRGSKELPVEAFRGFKVGDVILIEDALSENLHSESKTVTFVVSTPGDFKLMLDTPVVNTYPGESTVTLVKDKLANDGDGAAGAVGSAQSSASSASAGETVSTSSEPYNCAQGFDTWETGWSKDKKFYCCQYYGRGCPVTTTSLKHDCAKDFDTWEASWNSDKKYWCCKYYGRGCPKTSAACAKPCQFKGVTLTCSERIQYSATHQFLGQPEACDKGRSQVLSECPACNECQLKDAECETNEGDFPYDCNTGQETWKEGQKRWCCDNFQKGCPDPTPEPDHLPQCATRCVVDGTTKTCGQWIQSVAAFDFANQARSCAMAVSTVLKECPVCSVCSLGDSGCVDEKLTDSQDAGVEAVEASEDQATTSPPYDCAAGFVNWEDGWSDTKKTWCCSEKGLGCSEEASSTSFDCASGFDDWETGWGPEQKDWCCANKQIACAPASLLK